MKNANPIHYVLLIVCFGILPMNGATAAGPFLAADHDLRIAISLEKVRTIAAALGGAVYGDTVQLGEAPFYCGNPNFSLWVPAPPKFTSMGYLLNDGKYGVFAAIDFVGRARVHSECLGDPHPTAPIGGWVRIDAGNISGATTVPLTGSVYGNFDLLFGFNSSIKADLPILAAPLTPLRIALDLDTAKLPIKADFGTLDKDGDIWTTIGPSKSIPIVVNAGGMVDKATTRTIMFIDGTIGSEARLGSYGSHTAAEDALYSDLPLDANDDVGVNIRTGFFGSKEPDIEGTGLLGALLPIRLQGEIPYDVLGTSYAKQVSALIDGAIARPILWDSAPAFEIQLKSSRGWLHDPRYTAHPPHPRILPHWSWPWEFSGRVIVDRLTIENDELAFRIADFRVEITNSLLPAIKLSSGGLQTLLNGGRIPIAFAKQSYDLSLPDCIDMQILRFLPRSGSTCKDYPYPRPFGFLSWEPHPSDPDEPPPKTKSATLKVAPNGLSLRISPEGIRGGVALDLTLKP